MYASYVAPAAPPSADLRASRRFFRTPVPARLAARMGQVPGVEYRDGQLTFDRLLHTEETAGLLTAHLKGEPLQVTERLAMVGVGELSEPTASDLRAINKAYNGEPLSADDVVVFQDWAINDQMTRRPVKFTAGYLKALVPSFQSGRTVLLHHSERFAIGWTFDADVTKATVRGVEASWLRVKWFAVTRGATAERLQQIEDVKAVLKYVSIEARGGKWQFQEIEGQDGSEYFYVVEASDDAEAGELSRVYLGAVHGAGDNKLSAGSSMSATGGEDSARSDDRSADDPSAKAEPSTTAPLAAPQTESAFLCAYF